MPSFVSQFGAASLEVQEELRRSVKRGTSVSRAANLIRVELDRETFIRERGGDGPEEIEAFRSELLREIEVFLESYDWGLSGPLAVHLFLNVLGRPCTVRTFHADALFDLRILDDRGERTEPVRFPTVVIGRAHEAPPRAFVPVYDGSRSLSREHLQLGYVDGEFRLKLMGRNPTTRNAEPLDPGMTAIVVPGDTIGCGPHSIVIGEPRF